MEKERILTEAEYNLIEYLFGMTDKQLYKVMKNFLIFTHKLYSYAG